MTATAKNRLAGTWWNKNYSDRASAMISNSAGTTSADVELTIPVDWDEFWNTIRSDGTDVVLVDPATNTVITDFRRASFTYASRVLVLEADAVTDGTKAQALWVYYGYASESTDRATWGGSASSAKTATIDLRSPVAADLVVTADLHADEDPPSEGLVKRSAETSVVWVDLSRVLQPRARVYNGGLGLETITSVGVSIESGGSPVGSMVATEDTLLVDGHWVVVEVTGGTDATDYTLIITITTTHQVHEERVVVKVRDPDED